MVRARLVLTGDGRVIADGAVLVRGRRIAAAGPWRDLRNSIRGPATDLGEVILMPGLVNAHCHLDYTDMAGQFPPPKRFSDWLKLITEAKAGWNYSDYAASWLNGAHMLLRTGTTTVGDIEAVPDLLPDVWESTPLRVVSFLEMIGITPRRTPREVLGEALQLLSSLPGSRGRAGLSPHAPYSTVPELLRLTASAAKRHRWPVAIHVAESALEYEMFTRGKGEMYEWMRRARRDMSDCGKNTPVAHLAGSGLLGENVLAVHANYLGRRDPALLAEHRTSVAHCPRSHCYFRHDPFPLRRLLRAGVNVCIATDSLASVCVGRKQSVELSMFDEMRALQTAESSLTANEILRMATVNAARALGMAGQVGQISEGARADLICLAADCKGPDAPDWVLHNATRVCASMINGRWVLPPHRLQAPTRPSRQ